MERRSISFEKQRKRAGLVFVLPFVIGLALFFVFPVLTGLRFSFSKLTMNPMAAGGFDLTFVGLENYRQALLVDDTFRKQVLISLRDMAVNVPIVVLFSFFLASILNQKFVGRAAARTIFFLPLVIASGVVLRMDAADYFGNYLASGSQFGADAQTAGTSLSSAVIGYLTELNLPQQFLDFIVSTVSRVYDITVMSAVPIIIFLAGLQSVSPSLFEAAYMEGATGWEVFWKISFPMVSPMILVTVVYCIVDSFTGVSNQVINRIHSTTFDSFSFGLSSAMAWSYTLLVLCCILLVFLILGRKINYHR